MREAAEIVMFLAGFAFFVCLLKASGFPRDALDGP